MFEAGTGAAPPAGTTSGQNHPLTASTAHNANAPAGTAAQSTKLGNTNGSSSSLSFDIKQPDEEKGGAKGAMLPPSTPKTSAGVVFAATAATGGAAFTFAKPASKATDLTTAEIDAQLAEEAERRKVEVRESNFQDYMAMLDRYFFTIIAEHTLPGSRTKGEQPLKDKGLEARLKEFPTTNSLRTLEAQIKRFLELRNDSKSHSKLDLAEIINALGQFIQNPENLPMPQKNASQQKLYQAQLAAFYYIQNLVIKLGVVSAGFAKGKMQLAVNDTVMREMHSQKSAFLAGQLNRTLTELDVSRKLNESRGLNESRRTNLNATAANPAVFLGAFFAGMGANKPNMNSVIKALLLNSNTAITQFNALKSAIDAEKENKSPGKVQACFDHFKKFFEANIFDNATRQKCYSTLKGVFNGKYLPKVDEQIAAEILKLAPPAAATAATGLAAATKL